jgi:N6-L-threonylcarbamoyladenine synthase
MAVILGIESSCDDTSAAIVRDGYLLSNVVSGQAVHESYGGVVPELASRAHQQHIVPVVHEAMRRAGVRKEELSAIAFTRGPGLMGSLLVGVSFAKGFARSLNIPLIDVNHLAGHVLAHFIKTEGEPNLQPQYPFLCLLVSGGNSQIILVKAYNEMEILGQTIDDAAGEAIDKCSKVMGLGYPGGPVIDKLARQGDPKAFSFSKPHIPGLDYSFSGLKTSFLYSLRDWLKEDLDFIEHHKNDLAASLEATVVEILMDKLRRAVKEYHIKEVAVAGGVSANNGLRNAFREHAERYGWNIFIPPFSYTTDNAAMIAITGYFKYLDKDFCAIDLPAYSRVSI